MIKKIFILLLMTFPCLALASTEIDDYCVKEPYPIKGSASTFVSNITGINFLATKTIEASIQKSLKKDLNSSFNVELYPFSIGDLKDGKFKKITITAPNINALDFNLSDFKAESLCPYNRIAFVNDDLFFAENFLLSYSAEISNSDLRRTVLSPKYLNAVNKIDFSISGIPFFKIYNPNIEIKNNRVYISFNLSYSNFFKNYDKTFNANTSLKVQDEKIVFSDIQLGNKQGLNSNMLYYVLNALNPFNQKIKIDKNNYAYIKTKELEIIDNTILTNGIVVIKKNYTAE